jgi:uncharacterized protein YndB with AHSA1/START domain
MSSTKHDFREATPEKMRPKAVADGAEGMILATAEVGGTPEEAFRAFTSAETEKWWKLPGVYHLKDWKSDLRVRGRWSVTVEIQGAKDVQEWGEFCELKPPSKVVMTRRFAGHPSIGERETTLTVRFDPSPHGTLVTAKEEGLIGIPEAAYGNAENWEKVLGWLDEYLSSRK